MVMEKETNSGIFKKQSMARSGMICIELNFIRDGEGRSRRAKIKSFWEFIDAKKNLVPLHPSQGDAGSIMSWPNSSICQKSGCEYRDDDQSLNSSSQDTPEKDSNSANSDVCTPRDQLSPANRRIWYDELRIFKELGLDRVALVASNACKRCLRDERNNSDKEPELADSVPQSHEELEADLQAFQERIKLQKPKCAYKDPGKYQHLIQ